jgi:hypothetical protein
MAVFGLELLILGFVLGVPIPWNLGILLLIIGLALWIFGTIGHEVRGRRNYYQATSNKRS